MTEFKPEVWLLAARIAYPNEKYIWDDEYGRPRLVDPKIPADAIVPFDPYAYGDDYRALREALDKKYGFVIYWDEEYWIAEHPGEIEVVLADSDVVSLMMRQVQELREAGVSE